MNLTINQDSTHVPTDNYLISFRAAYIYIIIDFTYTSGSSSCLLSINCSLQLAPSHERTGQSNATKHCKKDLKVIDMMYSENKLYSLNFNPRIYVVETAWIIIPSMHATECNLVSSFLKVHLAHWFRFKY